MATAKKNKVAPEAATPQPISVQRDVTTARIFSPLRNKWLVETPEEGVRQAYLCILVNEYGFTFDQIGEEIPVTKRGSGQARADFLIWRSAADKVGRKHPFIVVECKADNVQIDAETYTQGANYAQYCKARFFVTHNNRETKFWRVDHDRMMPNFDEIENIPHADASDREVEELISKLRIFKEEEFADVLQRCHDVIRNRESHDPTKAFDETAKILFVKVWVERELKDKKRRKNICSVEFLDDQVGDDPINDLFAKTKRHYEKAALFHADERVNLRPETSREIVRLLQSYNLSDTSEDIKGIAFERFLGRTFRGEIGQFFTPRPIVEFMIQMLAPKEGDIICDPAAGSGGFLIRSFEIVRQKILRSADDEYRAYEADIRKKKKGLSEEERAKALLKKYDEMQAQLDQRLPKSRTWKLANECIFGTDKNDRMARTSKMNMIMHGDGHGGVHHWNGFLNVNGIFESRFDLILTNPPFGSKLESDEKILANDIALPEEVEEHYERLYKEPYRQARAALKAAVNKPIASLFELPTAEGSIKTELLFIERCLNLLKPGGRLGIVLPESVFNNPTMAYVRHFVEDQAKILAVVSLPADTFAASGATVKTSLLFLRKFSVAEQSQYDAWAEQTHADARDARRAEIEALEATLAKPFAKQADFLAGLKKPTAAQKAAASVEARETNEGTKEQKKLAARTLRDIASEVELDARRRLRKKARYPIFMYEADRVGITATGAADDNELFPNPRIPAGVTKTALELYREFVQDPKTFLDAAQAEGKSL